MSSLVNTNTVGNVAGSFVLFEGFASSYHKVISKSVFSHTVTSKRHIPGDQRQIKINEVQKYSFWSGWLVAYNVFRMSAIESTDILHAG